MTWLSQKNWLKTLIQTAEQTDSVAVSPLVCEGFPLHAFIHFAGGETGIEVVNGERHFIDEIYHGHVLRKNVTLKRRKVTCSEYHCSLIRTSIFEKVGRFDPEMANTKGELDFSMSVAKVGGKIYFEPAAVVTYLDTLPFTWCDVSFFTWRWSDSFTVSTLKHLRKKWNLVEDEYFTSRIAKIGFRRHRLYAEMIGRVLGRPKLAQGAIKKGRKRGVFVRCIIGMERIINKLHVQRLTR